MDRQKENAYYAGDEVSAKVEPNLKLIVRRYINRVYYCRIKGHPEMKDLVYFESELVEDLELISKNKLIEKGDNGKRSDW